MAKKTIVIFITVQEFDSLEEAKKNNIAIIYPATEKNKALQKLQQYLQEAFSHASRRYPGQIMVAGHLKKYDH